MSEHPSEASPAIGAPPDRLVASLALGVIAGFLSGMFGVGGGIVIVPGLVLLMRMDQRLAHGTSLAAALPISMAATVGFAASGNIDWVAALPILLGGATGALIGVRALQRVPLQGLRLGFAAVLAASAVRLLITLAPAHAHAQTSLLSLVGLVALGLASGVLAGLMGVGGGIVIVPALLLEWGLSAPVAKGTSLVVIIGTALVATIQNSRKRNVDLRLALRVGLAGVGASFAGSLIAAHLTGALANDLFAALLILVALRLVLVARSMRKKERLGKRLEPVERT
ncbi:MAG: sulfite exporter TauE/SafE family protein [Actinomycetota bacterium]